MQLFKTLRLTVCTAVLLAAVGTPAAVAYPVTTVTMTVAPSPLIAGATATYTIAISPQPSSGTVTILDNGQSTCTTPALAAAVTTCSAPSPSIAGNHIIWASYSSGLTTNSSYQLILVQAATTTKVSASPKLADPGAAMSYVATVSPRPQRVELASVEDPEVQACSPGCGDPVETADFSVDGVAIDACVDRPVNLETGVATCSAAAPAAGGRHVVTASYSGTDSLLPSEGQDDYAVKAPGATLSAGALDFGGVTVGASSSRSVTLTSSGTGDLHVGATAVGAPYTITANACAGVTLPAGATCAIALAYTPTAAGASAGTLTIAADAGPQTVALTGSGSATITEPPTGAKFAPNESTTLSISKSDNGSSSVTVPVRCPTGVACTLDGTVVIATSDLAKAAHSSATQVQTIARFSGVRVAAGKVREIKLKLSPAFIKSAQRRGVRLIRATLTIHTKFTDGTEATSKQRVKIRIPKAVVKKAAKRALAPKFTG
jgi:Abnormal spindle-like microcephaly-assoc'd, ASPM-SPD-2-Hydin